MAQSCHAGEQGIHWDKTNKELTSIFYNDNFLCLSSPNMSLFPVWKLFIKWTTNCKGPMELIGNNIADNKQWSREFKYFTVNFFIITSNNWRLQSAGNNERSKHFSSSAVLCVSFTWQLVKTPVIRLQGVKGRNARDQIAFCAFHSLLVEVQANAGYIQVTDA